MVSDGIDIRTKGLSKNFGTIQALKDLDLEKIKKSVQKIFQKIESEGTS